MVIIPLELFTLLKEQGNKTFFCSSTQELNIKDYEDTAISNQAIANMEDFLYHIALFATEVIVRGNTVEVEIGEESIFLEFQKNSIKYENQEKKYSLTNVKSLFPILEGIDNFTYRKSPFV